MYTSIKGNILAYIKCVIFRPGYSQSPNRLSSYLSFSLPPSIPVSWFCFFVVFKHLLLEMASFGQLKLASSLQTAIPDEAEVRPCGEIGPALAMYLSLEPISMNHGAVYHPWPGSNLWLLQWPGQWM